MRRPITLVVLPVLIALAVLASPAVRRQGTGDARTILIAQAKGVKVSRSAGAIVLTRAPSGGHPGYALRVDRSPFRLQISRGGSVLLAGPSGSADSQLELQAGGKWYGTTAVQSSHWNGSTLQLTVSVSLQGATVRASLAPRPAGIHLQVSLQGGPAPALFGPVFSLSSAGHWYGHGEFSNRVQPWPLDAGSIVDPNYDPLGARMVAPFWFTSSAVGLQIPTTDLMEVDINKAHDGMGRFFLHDAPAFSADLTVERTPATVYGDFDRTAGRPEKVGPTRQQFALPLWNTYAQFYRTETADKVLKYAQGLAGAHLAGHDIQIDSGWDRYRGNLTFDPARFPDPRAFTSRIHALGYGVGLWASIFISKDSVNYQDLLRRGYLLADAADPSKPCTVTWVQVGGLLDLANPGARAWYAARLQALMAEGVNGFKFDTEYFDRKCRPHPGFRPADYPRLGAQLFSRFDLQGAGLRTPGGQRYGQAMREADKYTDFPALQTAVSQLLALSVIGYPYVETDMIGGSLHGPPPEKVVLVRWAQAAALTPMMYASTSPLGVTNPELHQSNAYDAQTVALYRAAIDLHRKLSGTIWQAANDAVKTGMPVMKPLFFDFPREAQTYTIADEWLLAGKILAAPVLTDALQRDIYIPPGAWQDENRHAIVHGPTVLHDYPAPLAVVPYFIKVQG